MLDVSHWHAAVDAQYLVDIIVLEEHEGTLVEQ